MSGAYSSGSASDVAALSFAIDSSQVVMAGQSLDDLQRSTDGQTAAYDRLNERSQRFIAVARDMGESISQMRRQFQDTAQSLDEMLANLDRARATLDGTSASFAKLSDANSQVLALGESFGIATSGLEAFANQSAMLGLSAGQTTLALQRITEALQNQTLAGQQVRQQIQGLGIDLAGLSSNDSAGVLSSVVARLRGSADGLGKYQTESSILGITDPQTLNGINNQDYIPFEARRSIAFQQQAQRQIGQTTDLVSRDERGFRNDDAEYADLNGRYNLDTLGTQVLGRQNVFTGLSGSQMSGLAATLGLPTGTNFSSQDDQLAAFRYFQANPNSDVAQSALRLSARVGQFADRSGISGVYRHLFDGTYSSNEADIQDQYDAATRSSAYGRFDIGAFLRAQGSDIANTFNLYTPRINPGDTRPQDGSSQIRNDQATAAALSGFGDPTLNAYQSDAARIRALRDPSAIGRFQGAYGTQEGQTRYYSALGVAQGDQSRALTPYGDQLDQAQRQSYLLSQPEAQRPELTALMSFMGSNPSYGDPRALYSGGTPMSLSDSLNTGGTSGGPGVLSKQLSDAFLKWYNTTTQNAATEVIQGLQRQDAEAQTMLSATQGAAGDPISQAVARLGAGIQNDYVNLPAQTRAGLSLSSYTAQRRANLGTTAQQGGQDTLTRAQQDFAEAGDSALGPFEESAKRSFDVIKSFSSALADAAVSGDKATAAVRAMAEQALQLSDAGARAKFDGQSWNGASSNLLSASFDQLAANSPPSQRAFIRAAQGPLTSMYQQGDPALLGQGAGPALSAADLAKVQALASQLGVNPSLAAIVAQNEGGGDPGLSNMFQVSSGAMPQATAYLAQHGMGGTYDPNTRDGSMRLGIGYLGAIGQMPGFSGNLPGIAAGYNVGPYDSRVQAFIGSGDQNVGVLPPIAQRYVQPFMPDAATLLARGNSDPATSALLSSLRAQSNASTGLEISDANAAQVPRNNVEDQLLALLSSGQTGAAALLRSGVNSNVQNPALGAAQARLNQANTVQGFQEQAAGNTASTNQDIETNQRLAQAYLAGGDAVQKATAALQAHREMLQGLITPGQEAARTTQLLADSLSKEQASAAQSTHQLDLQTQRTQTLASAGVQTPYAQQASAESYDYVQAGLQANPQMANDSAYKQMLQDQAQTIQNNKEITASQTAVNNAFSSMGQSIFSTFENAAFSGERFKRTLGELLESISQIILKLTIEKPLENYFTNTVGGWFGNSLQGVGGSGNSAGGLLGGVGNWLFGGGTSVSTIGSASTDALSISPLSYTFARGGVFGPNGRINYHASGSVVNSPTGFTDGSGNLNVMGEAGPEGILPLQVLPNGSLGVQSSGAGGGVTIVHNSTINIQGAGGGAGGQMDAKAARAYQQQIQKLTNDAFKAAILDNQRPGGMLYNGSAMGT